MQSPNLYAKSAEWIVEDTSGGGGIPYSSSYNCVPFSSPLYVEDVFHDAKKAMDIPAQSFTKQELQEYVMTGRNGGVGDI